MQSGHGNSLSGPHTAILSWDQLGGTKTMWRSSEKDERLYTWELLL